MRLLLLLLVVLLLSCQTDEAPPNSPVEALCSSNNSSLEYADFYWDNLRASDPALFTRALQICSRQCPQSDACAPVLSVARWYHNPPLTNTEGSSP